MTLALDRMRELWEFSPMSASQIGTEMGVTKNVIIGHRYRKGWTPRRETPREPSTVFTRCDALEAAMNAVLAETRPFVEERKKIVTADPELVGIAAE